MDCKLCLWDKSGVRCDTITAHEGSISKIMTDQYGIGLSSGYDHTLMVWDFNSLKLVDTMKFHT